MSENETPTELAPENYGDPNAPDIMEAMDKYFEQEQAVPEPAPEPVSDPAPEPQKAADEVKPDTTPEADPEPVKEPVADEEEELIEEEFFSDVKPDDKPDDKPEAKDGFDEEAFDKQTEEEVKGMEKHAGEKFRALKAELKEMKKQAITPEVQSKLEAAELRAQEVEGLKARLAEVSSQSAKLQVENDEVYHREVAEPAADLFGRADALAKMYETEPSILRAIIKERDRKTQNELIAEHLKDFSDFDRSEAYRMVQDFNGLIAKRERMMENAEATLERNKQARAEQEQQLLREQREAVLSNQKQFWEKYKERIPGLVEGGEETARFKELFKKSMAIDFSQSKASDQAFAAFAGTTLPYAVQQIAVLRKRLSAYEKDDSTATKKAPSPGGSVSPTPTQAKEPKDFMDAMAQDYQFAR